MRRSWFQVAGSSGWPKRHTARSETPSEAKFDLATCALADVPYGYLLVSFRRDRLRQDVAVRVAEELVRRHAGAPVSGALQHLIARTVGGSCALCPKKGIYIVSLKLYCSNHRDAAWRDRKTKCAVANERSRLIDQQLNDKDKEQRVRDLKERFAMERSIRRKRKA